MSGVRVPPPASRKLLLINTFAELDNPESTEISPADFSSSPPCGRNHLPASPPALTFASPLGDHLDASALRRRYATSMRRTRLRLRPFHSLRHFFASMAVSKATLVQVHPWMGDSHIQTTAQYLAIASRAVTPPCLLTPSVPLALPQMSDRAFGRVASDADHGESGSAAGSA